MASRKWSMFLLGAIDVSHTIQLWVWAYVLLFFFWLIRGSGHIEWDAMYMHEKGSLGVVFFVVIGFIFDFVSMLIFKSLNLQHNKFGSKTVAVWLFFFLFSKEKNRQATKRNEKKCKSKNED